GDTLHAGVRWQLFFLDDVYVFRDGLRGHEPTGFHQADGRFDLHNLHGCGRWRRWRGRRWRQQDGRQHGLGQRLRVNQRNENQNQKEKDLQNHGDNHGPRLVRLLFCTLNKHFFKHGNYYLLPAGARRGCPLPFPLGLLPAAVPVPTATPCPRHLFQATTKGAAIPKLEYVPTTIPTTRAKENARSTWPPIRNRTSTVRKVNPLVKIVRDSVWLIDLLTTSANGSLRNRRLFSRIRSKITIVSFIEYPTSVRSAAITVSEISKCKSEKKPSVIKTS